MSELTPNDVDLIFEALQAMEELAGQREFNLAMFEAMTSRGKTPDQIVAGVDRRMAEGQSKQKILKERFIFLRAKLLAPKQSLAADAVMDEARR